MHYSIIEESQRIKSNNYTLDIIESYNGNIKLMDNEFYIITILIYGEGNLDIEILGEKAEEKKEEKKEEREEEEEEEEEKKEREEEEKKER